MQSRFAAGERPARPRGQEVEGLAGRDIRSSGPPHSEEDPGSWPRASGEGGRGSRHGTGAGRGHSSPAGGRDKLRSTDLDRRAVVFAHSSRLGGQRGGDQRGEGSSAIETPSAGAAGEEVEVRGRSAGVLDSRLRLADAAARIRFRWAAGAQDIQAGGRIRHWDPALAGATLPAGTPEVVVAGHRREGAAGTGCGGIRPPCFAGGKEGTGGIVATLALRGIPGFDRVVACLLL